MFVGRVQENHWILQIVRVDEISIKLLVPPIKEILHEMNENEVFMAQLRRGTPFKLMKDKDPRKSGVKRYNNRV